MSIRVSPWLKSSIAIGERVKLTIGVYPHRFSSRSSTIWLPIYPAQWTISSANTPFHFSFGLKLKSMQGHHFSIAKENLLLRMILLSQLEMTKWTLLHSMKCKYCCIPRKNLASGFAMSRVDWLQWIKEGIYIETAHILKITG